MILLDLSAAFDCVVHAILKYKLGNYGFRGQALSLLSFYLHERNFRVKTDSGKLSDLHTFSLGVPQGSVLGPLFFIFSLMISRTAYITVNQSIMQMIPPFTVQPTIFWTLSLP